MSGARPGGPGLRHTGVQDPRPGNRMQLRTLFTLLALAVALTAPAGAADAEPEEPSFVERIDGLDRSQGFVETYIDRTDGRVLVALPAVDQDGTMLRFIHALRLTRGLGSNPLGLDRGWG